MFCEGLISRGRSQDRIVTGAGDQTREVLFSGESNWSDYRLGLNGKLCRFLVMPDRIRLTNFDAGHTFTAGPADQAAIGFQQDVLFIQRQIHFPEVIQPLVKRQMGQGGTVVALELAGGKEAAFRFLNALEIILISNNLGDAKSIITHPATTTHQRLTDAQRDVLGISPGLLRLSVGIEDTSDLIKDLKQALAAV